MSQKTYQKIILVGNVGRDAEQRTTQKGGTMTTFSLAVEGALPGQDGQPATLWFDVVTTGKQAEICAQYVKKGNRVLVEGKLQPVRLFNRQDGTPGASLSLWAAPVGVTLLGGANGGNGQAEAAPAAEEDELPF
jgi:single-strand DNA-binding protein